MNKEYLDGLEKKISQNVKFFPLQGVIFDAEAAIRLITVHGTEALDSYVNLVKEIIDKDVTTLKENFREEHKY